MLSCSNILEFESLRPCSVLGDELITRVWDSVDGLVRYDDQRLEYFIVARYPGDDNLTVLRTCNIPAEFLRDRATIRFFGNEYRALVEEIVEEEDEIAFIVPFEITFIERVRQ